MVYISGMLCPHCQAENPTAFGYCQNCTKPLSSIAVPPPPSSPTPRTMSLIAALSLAAIVLATATLGIILPIPNQRSEAFQEGYRFGRIFFPLLIAWAIAYPIAGRKRVRKANLFALIFCLIGFFFIGTSLLGSGVLGHGLETPEQRFGRLMREAAGMQPVRPSWFPYLRRWDDSVRERYRTLLTENKEYEAEVEKLNAGRDFTVNGPETFADPSLDAHCLEYLRRVSDIENAHEQRVQEDMGKLREILASGARSPAEREAILKGVDTQLAAQMARRQELLNREQLWISAAQSEYTYAAAHAGEFQNVNGHLIVKHAATRNQFNDLMRTQEDRRKEFLSAQKAFAEYQAQALKKFGVKPRDLRAQ